MKRVMCIAVGLIATCFSSARAQDAKQILDASGMRGGLAVVIGCEKPSLLADLGAGDAYLVHGLDRDPARVAAARSYLRGQGLYGSVTVARWEGRELPLVDNLANLIVLTDDAQGVSTTEWKRVLAPRGVIADARKPRIQITRKDWPANFDEWTHYLHDASNNAVSGDTAVAPPRGLRWTCGPKYARSHEHFASTSGMVTAGGRLFYIMDEGPISSVYLPPQWKLVARDAFSGVLLWQRPIANWESHLRGFRSGPPEIGRRLVATADRLYVALGYGDPVTVLDAATGERRAALDGTSGARELLLDGGALYVLADDMTTADHDKRKEWINGVWPGLEIWYRFPHDAIPMYGMQRIVAIKTETGEVMWKQGFQAPGRVMPTTMAVDEGRLCIQTVSDIVCLDAAGGDELWRSRRPVARSRFSWSTPSLVIHDGVVLSADRKASDNVDGSAPAQGSRWIISSGDSQQKQPGELLAFSLDDGRELWRAPCFENYNTPIDILVIHDVVWVGNLRHGDDPGYTQGRDLRTGRIVAVLPEQKAGGHHRCYRNKATVRWLMVGRGGIQFVDPANGAVQGNSWVRGACQYGDMPANGLVYVPQHSCACQPKEMLAGLNVLASESSASSAGEGPPPLEKGPAYDASRPSSALDPSRSTDWPTYRRDAGRSGYQDLPAPSPLDIAWTAKLSSPITAPVAADGVLFVAETARHALHALSATDAKSLWTFLADGRIDSPPTLSRGLCLFGTRSGFVYCLRAADGTLVWRFRAAPVDRRLFAYEQLESVWPVHGSVLVDETLSDGAPVAYFAAGRSSRLDGGIHLYALAVATGELLQEATVSMTAPRENAGVIREAALPDILTLQHGALWMRGLGVDAHLNQVAARSHLFAPRGFLDDTWWHRTYWMVGAAIGGGYSNWPLIGNVVPAGRLLVFDGGRNIYGYGRMSYRVGDGHVRPQAARDYKLFAETPPPESESRRRAEILKRGKGAASEPPWRRRIEWSASLPFVARSLVLARDALLVAGGPTLPGVDDHGPGTLWIVSRQDGAKRAQCVLPAPPVLDGMALTGSGLFVSTADGSVVRLANSEKRPENDRVETANFITKEHHKK